MTYHQKKIRQDNLRYFSFEMISSAAPSYFPARDFSGLLYLLHIFHSCNSLDLQITIADILRTQLGETDDNRRTLFKLVADIDLAKALFPTADPDELKSRLTATCFPYPVLEEEQKQEERKIPIESSAPLDRSIDQLVQWYFSESQNNRRQAVQTRIERQLPKLIDYRKAIDKSKEKKI